jgi:hypothetical protein
MFGVVEVEDVSTRINISFLLYSRTFEKRFVFFKGDVQIKAQHSEVFLQLIERRKVSIHPPSFSLTRIDLPSSQFIFVHRCPPHEVTMSRKHIQNGDVKII